MNYTFFHIDLKENDLMEIKLTPLQNSESLNLTLKEKLHEYFGGIEMNLTVFIADHPEFWRLKYIRSLINKKRETSSLNEDSENVTMIDYQPYPILTIYSEDSFESFLDTAGILSKRRRMFGIKYLDSCIWQYWVNIGKLGKERTDEDEKNYNEELNRVAKQIKWNIDFDWKVGDVQFSNIYKYDKAALEFCEFNTRVYKNSYISNIEKAIQVNADYTIGSHAGEITPFPFFEESYFFKRLNTDFDDNGFAKFNKDASKLRWRVLLIDDKKERCEHLKKLFESEAFGQKFKIIKSGNESSSDKPSLLIDHVGTLKDAEEQLSKKTYDIVLLDYLLKAESENSSRRSLGTEMFLQQNDGRVKLKQDKIKRGPDNKLWIFLTSCYSSAFMDELRENGISFNDENWIINRGADPLNSPNAFLYNFTKFLERQLNHFKSDEGKNIKSIWKYSLQKLIKAQEEMGKGGNACTRGWANNTLTKILNYWNNIEMLRDIGSTSVNNPSLFARSFLNSELYNDIRSKEYNSGLYGYLTHLLFMLTSSDGYEWEEMKTDLEVIKRIIKIESGSDDDKLFDYGHSIIRERIEQLKKQYDS